MSDGNMAASSPGMARGFSFGPPPAHVIERAVPAQSASDGAVRYLLSDSQVDLTGEHTRTHRLVARALTAEGVSTLAAFAAAYQPAYERLVIHRIRISRDGAVTDIDDPEAFQLLRRETNMERRIYDGALTADLQLPDVRVGDVVETWYTVYGSNPALKGAFESSYIFGFSEPVEETWVRVRASAGRKFRISLKPDGFTPAHVRETDAGDGVIDREWMAARAPVFRYDDSTPPWWAGHQRLTISDALSWSDVANLFRDAYAPQALPAELEQDVAAIAAEHATPEARTAAALRFVQNQVRYLSVSIGAGGFIPRSVDEIWSRRFGDCKDVSRLLVSILARLDIEASAALVNTLGMKPDEEPQARPYAFNHCITRVRIKDRIYWLDATCSEQGGDLDHIVQSSFDWALPIVENANIERMAQRDGDVVLQEVTETFTMGARDDSPAKLIVDTLYRDWKADQMRLALRREGLPRMIEHWTSYYDRAYGGARMDGDPEISSAADTGELRVIERYTLTKPWRIDNNIARFSTVDDMVSSDLSVLPHAGRTQPLWLGPARRYQRNVEINLQQPWPIAPWNDIANGPGVKGRAWFNASLKSTRRLLLKVDYAITAPTLHPGEFDAFCNEVVKLRSGSGVTLQSKVRRGKFITGAKRDTRDFGAGDWGLTAVGGALILIALVRLAIGLMSQ